MFPLADVQSMKKNMIHQEQQINKPKSFSHLCQCESLLNVIIGLVGRRVGELVASDT